MEIAKYKCGEVVRVRLDSTVHFTVASCHRDLVHDDFIYTANNGDKFNENDLELCPKLVKKKVGFWKFLYQDSDGIIHVSDTAYETKEDAEFYYHDDDNDFIYLGTKYFECEVEVEE